MAALVVEGDNLIGRPRQVGDDKADARVEFAGVPSTLATTRPACSSSKEGFRQ